MKKISVLLLLSILIASFSSLLAQEDLPVWKKLRYLSEEEMNLEVRSADGFVETDPPKWPIKNVAEFDPMQAVLVRYPFGVPYSVMKELAEDLELITIVSGESQENTVRNLYESQGVNLANCRFLHAPTNSWWVRDYGPWFVFDGDGKPGIVDFPYNRPRPNDNNIPAAVAEYLNIDLYGMNVYHTGGNYMTDGLGKSSSTDLIVEENPAKNEDEIDSLHFTYLAIEDYYVLYDPLDDYIKHIDCWGKFLTPGKVIIGQVAQTDYRYADFEAAAEFFESTISSYGVPYEVHRVYTPGNNLVTPYTNCLIVNDKILVPLTGSPWDDEAIASYEEAMPGYQIIGIPYNSWYNTDALHCRSKGVADLGMLYISHMPVLGDQNFQPVLNFRAEFTAYSGAEIYADSAFLHYAINEEEYETALFAQQENGVWECTIDGFEAMDEVDYYIEVRDASGRVAMHPYIGVSDPHEFSFQNFVPELMIASDTLVYDSDETMKNGLDVSVYNTMFSTTSIQDITLPDNDDYELQLIDVPGLPIDIDPTSYLNFKLSFKEPLPPLGTMTLDSIVLKTQYFDYPVYLEIDRSGVNIKNKLSSIELEIYPNPSNADFTFRYFLEDSEEVLLNIYSTEGQLIYSKKQFQQSGEQNLNWSGIDQAGQMMPSGNYFYLIKLRDGELKGMITKI